VRVALVVAMARNRVIGRHNALPWRLPADMAHFRKVTMGRPVVMGRKTFESIGKSLPGRTNIVITHNRAFAAPGCIVAGSLDEAWNAAGDVEEACVIGGTTLFAETLPLADVIHLTEVDADIEGDTLFPEFDRGEWREVEIARLPADERHAYPLRILELTRKRG
jgi:dihydrofolate reductase